MSGNDVLITGATGVVGSAVAPLFLREPDTRVWLLLRARSEQHLRERLRALFEFWRPALPDGAAPQRVRTLRGDVSAPRLGLSPADYEALGAALTHVVHCAASVKMNMSAEQARRSSVDAALGVVDLTERCRRGGRFRKLDYVSTLGVAGRMRGLVPEQPLRQRREFHNTYESSKAEAETLLLERIEHDGLPATIHRPSMVVGDSRSGRIIHFQIFYYLCEFLTGRPTRGLMPDIADVKLDTVPVDYLARALHWSSGTERSNGRILHLCSGPELALGIPALSELLRARLAAAGDRLPRLRRIPLAWFRRLLPLVALAAPQKLRNALKNLHLFLDYLDDRQAFDNRLSVASLAAAGIELPAPAVYLGNVLDYYHAHGRRGRI